ncbi:MAG: MFS transporter [Acidimicrobiia bacterium]
MSESLPVEDDGVRWRAVVPAIAGVTVAMLPGFLTAGLAVQVSADIELSLLGLGVVIGVFFAASAVASPLMGALAQRVGWVAGIRTSSVLAAASLAGIGLSATSAVSLGAWFVLGGVAAALSHPAANLAVARCVPPGRQGLLFGVKHAAVPMATFLGGVAVPAVALTVGWEWAYLGAALLALFVAAAVPGDPAAHEITARRSDATPPRLATPLRLLVALAVASMLGIAGIDALASFIVTYSVDIGVGESAAGLLLAAGSVAGITTRLVAGWLIDRSIRADLTAIAALLVVGALGIAGIASGGQAWLVVGGLVGFAAGWGWSGLFTFAIVRGNQDAAATATGITMTGTFIGAAAGPPLFGWLADRVSYEAAWWATAASLVAAAVIMLYVRGRRRGSDE